MTDAFHPAHMNNMGIPDPPLNRLSWWGRFSGTANSPMISSGISRIGFESLGRRGGTIFKD